MPFLAGISIIHKALYGAAVVLILSLSIALFMADRRADKWERQAVKCNATLHSISTAKDEQKVVTRSNVEEAERGRSDAERVARRIEEAPVAGQCETPEAVLSADL